MQRSGGLPVLLILMMVLGIFFAVAFANTTPPRPAIAVIPTLAAPTDDPNAWQTFLRNGLGDSSTPLPTIAIPTQPFVVPTLALVEDNVGEPLEAAAIGDTNKASDVVAVPMTATPLTTTENSEDVAVPVTVISVTQPPQEWRPPPLIPPLNRDPLGRDHYWLMRPVDSNANNTVLFNYPYGSDGPDKSNPLRVHHGIDMPNPVGETVRAAGSGVVIWAADGRQEQSIIFQNSPSYGNVIFIEHDFSYEGQIVYTLYAHLSASLVVPGQYVQAGEVIGLIGNTGRVTGPHVHFEVRLGDKPENARYSNTYNPVLWMVPYVGHGVIAGRVVDANGNLIADADITVRNRANGVVRDTTTSYVYLGTGFDVNADPKWGENFAIADVPTGRYDVIVTIDGQRVIRQIDVLEGMTNWVELRPPESSNAQPTPIVSPEATTDTNGG